MTGVLIIKTLFALVFTVVSVFGCCWIMATCAAIADEKWDKWAEGFFVWLLYCNVNFLNNL